MTPSQRRVHARIWLVVGPVAVIAVLVGWLLSPKAFVAADEEPRSGATP